MADMHPSADYRNVERNAMKHLADGGISPLVPDGDEKFSTASAAEFVRVRLEPLKEAPQGRVTDSGTTRQATRARVLVVADVHAQGNGPGAGSVVDRVSGLASQVAHRLRNADIPLLDFVADPTGATPITGVALRFGAPHIQRVPPENGWHRRLVTCEGVWFPRHAE